MSSSCRVLPTRKKRESPSADSASRVSPRFFTRIKVEITTALLEPLQAYAASPFLPSGTAPGPATVQVGPPPLCQSTHTHLHADARIQSRTGISVLWGRVENAYQHAFRAARGAHLLQRKGQRVVDAVDVAKTTGQGANPSCFFHVKKKQRDRVFRTPS